MLSPERAQLIMLLRVRRAYDQTIDAILAQRPSDERRRRLIEVINRAGNNLIALREFLIRINS
jgi:hypothetical protein